MLFCIECKMKQNPAEKKKILCKACGNKIDKYTQVNSTYKFIDYLLLKEKVFRHFLLNSPVSPSKILAVLILQILPSMFLRLSNLHLSKLHIDDSPVDMMMDNLYVEMLRIGTYIILLYFFLRDIPFLSVVYFSCFSSFFSFFKILFILWEYEEIRFYLILDFLNCCSNITAFKCIEDDYLKVFSSVVISRGLSHLITFITIINLFKL